MKGLFYIAAFLLMLFEVAKVYFIMPLPGSQEMESIGIAYFLHAYRWWIRGLLLLVALVGFKKAWFSSKWITIAMILIIVGVSYATHFEMAAESMFYKPSYVQMVPASQNEVGLDRLILGIEWNGEARAYPIQFLGYHHQVPDTIGGKAVIVTYCTVCRSGRVYEPMVNSHPETFRLVGMDHYNAMFEDRSTKSWWRQATGEAVAGPMKGQYLPEVPALQTSLNTWLELHPASLIMQPDSTFNEIYADLEDYESGLRKGRLTRRDTASWQEKSWIAGIDIGPASKAYDWNELIARGVINDMLHSLPVAVIVARDGQSLFAFRRQDTNQQLSIRNDTLTDGITDYLLSGEPIDTIASPLRMLPVYQEYWHSWRTFHPETTRYPEK